MDEAIEEAIKEIQQPRSVFQLERFVLGQHSTPEMQYYQTLMELQSLTFNHKYAEINLKKQSIKIARLRVSSDELDQLEADELELGLEQTKISMIGNQREIEHLISIWETFPVKYSRMEIEAAQPEYWKARFTNNAEAMLLGTGQINPAHLESMKQAGVLDDFIAKQNEAIEVASAVRNLEA